MILEKLNQAREHIKNSKLKKAGWNDYSKYSYFTPEQINQLVSQAEKETGLIHTFNLFRDSNGLHGHLTLTEIETKEELLFVQATDIPQIKATNIAQQIGGAVTYTLRYMLMTAFDISDNSLDFDSKDNRDSDKPEVLPDDKFEKLIKGIKEHPAKAGRWISDTRKLYQLSDNQEKALKEWEDNL